MKSYAAGQICVWQGGSLWIGRNAGTTDTHVHHAIQISLALRGFFEVKTPSDAAWTAYRGAVIPCHQHHAYTATDAVVATIFVEPEAAEGRILLDRFGTGAVAGIPAPMAEPATRVLRDTYEQTRDDEPLVAAAWEAVRILTSGARPRTAVDARIIRAIEYIRERLHGPVLQEEIAEAVFLSPSRFRHLFVEETGMAFRPYVLWLRLQRVLEALSMGESLTNAAHAAGFADLAHMSRTFRRMFGVAPGMLGRDFGERV